MDPRFKKVIPHSGQTKDIIIISLNPKKNGFSVKQLLTFMIHFVSFVINLFFNTQFDYQMSILKNM